MLTGCLSSGVGLEVSNTAPQLNAFFLAIGTHDTNITGPQAHRVTFRQTWSNAMLANAIGPALLKHGKKWYFLDRRLRVRQRRAGALQEDLARARRHRSWATTNTRSAQTDFSSYMTKARNTDADVMVFCNYGPDTQNAMKAAIQLGINKKMKFGGILCGNDVAIGLPVDDIVGSTWGYVWGPDAGGATTKIYAALKTKAKNVDWRMYLGYMAGRRTSSIASTRRHDRHREADRRLRKLPLRCRQNAGRVLPQVRPPGDPTTYAGTIVAEEQAPQPKASTSGSPDASAASSRPSRARRPTTPGQKIISS